MLQTSEQLLIDSLNEKYTFMKEFEKKHALLLENFTEDHRKWLVENCKYKQQIQKLWKINTNYSTNHFMYRFKDPSLDLEVDFEMRLVRVIYKQVPYLMRNFDEFFHPTPPPSLFELRSVIVWITQHSVEFRENIIRYQNKK
jgi:hypothetical protein